MLRLMRAIALLALAYLIAAKFGLKLALVNPYATAVWPPTGIALAALLLWGNRLWPGVLIGAIVANVTTGDTITANTTLASIGIAAGNTLEALLGAHLVRHFAGGRHAFDRARDVFRFAALAAFTSTTVSATVGVACVWLFGLAKWTDISAIWVTWWVGDAGGDLIFAPMLILWVMNWRLRWNRSRVFEAALLLFVLCVLALTAFTNVFAPGRPVDLGRAFLCMPALLWAAFRFGQRETAATFLLASGIAIWGWLHGQVSGDLSPAYELLELQAYLGVTSIAILAVGAEVSERRRHEQSLDAQADVLRRQAQLLDLAPVLVRDTGDRIESWNSGAERLYGFKRSEAVGKISHALLQTRFPEPVEQCRAKLFANGHWQGELEHEARDGRRFVVASLWVLYRNKNGQPEAILEVNNDMTELRRAEEARLRLATIVESSDDAIFAKSLDGVIVSWNSGAERIYGYTAAEAIGRPIAMLAPPGREEEMPAILERLRRGEKWDHYETKRRRKDGTVIDVAVTISPIKSHSGEVTAASIVARDITDRKRLEEKLRQAQKLESIGVLAGGVAHDFNNLLVGILGNASLALDCLPSAHPAHESVQGVITASEAAAALVRQLLAYAGRGEFTVEPVSLPEVIRKMTKLLQASIPNRVDLRFDLAHNVPPVVGDPSQIQQVLMNLIINAAEAIGESDGMILVTIRAREIKQPDPLGAIGGEQINAGRYVVLKVQDTGCGMNDDTKSRVFDPFFTTKFTGRGLGLAAVLGIVLRHKGSIKVRSALGRGSTFEVLLPATEERPAKSITLLADLSGTGRLGCE